MSASQDAINNECIITNIKGIAKMSNVKLLSYMSDDLGGTEDSNYVLDWQRKESRSWASKHISWAMLNGRSLIMLPTDDPVTYTPVSQDLDLDKLRKNTNFRFVDKDKNLETDNTEVDKTTVDA